MDHPVRPAFDKAMTEAEFDRWYWPKEALATICQELNLARSGSKAQLRQRVLDRLAARPEQRTPKAPVPVSEVNWTKAALKPETIITPDITFGRNVRGFFKDQIGPKFVCTGEFMAWVKSNPGRPLSDAVDAWVALEDRKKDPGFRRPIAPHNNYLQYLRSFKDAFPHRTDEDAKRCWDEKKIRPASGGYVRFENSDLELLNEAEKH